MTAYGNRKRMLELAEEAGFVNVHFGYGSAPKNRLYYQTPDGLRSFSDNITALKSAIKTYGKKP